MRKTVFDIVYGTMEKGAHSDELFHQAVEGERSAGEFDGQERRYLRRCSYGTIERAVELDRVIGLFSKTPVRKMKPVIRTILRMGVYELWYMDSVPASATCNEMVKLAKKKNFQNLSGFVNGVLRSVARADQNCVRTELFAGCATEEEVLSVRYSLPEDLVELLVGAYGIRRTEQMAASFFKERPVTIRVQTMNAEIGTVRRELEEAGVCAEPCATCPQALHIRGFDRIDRLPGFAQGHFVVQDVSSLFPVLVSGIKPGDYVVDVCSSPGGKALHAADLLKGTGKVSARDVSEQKLRRIRENAHRLKADNLELKVWDGSIPDESWREKADVVLADVPCSGIGVISRKPEIKYTAVRHAEELQGLQRKIAAGAAGMLKPGGVFIYSTCTVNPAENEENARWITQNLPLRLVRLDDVMPGKGEQTAEGMLQLFPGVDEGDGFFVAKFRKEQAGKD